MTISSRAYARRHEISGDIPPRWPSRAWASALASGRHGEGPRPQLDAARGLPERRRPDRGPVGSTEQHAYLSLETDNILAERASVEAAEPLGVPVLPVLPYGVTGFTAYPGSPTLLESTLKPPVVWPEEGNPRTWREALGDGSFGGLYQRTPEDESRLYRCPGDPHASRRLGRIGGYSAHQSRWPSTSSRGSSPRLGAPMTRISRPSGPAS
jgi:hypothetical protein